MRVLGLIPARGGSKGVPGKNLAVVGGKSLLAWSIEAAGGLERVLVSTDAPEIADAARALGADVLERPAELARDETPMLDVVLHALEQNDADVVVLLQPTSPLRRREHVEQALRRLAETDADGVVSVVPVPHRYLPESAMALEGERLVALEQATATRRQDKRTLYARNGPAVLVVRTLGLAERGLYGGDLRAYLMDEAASIDVDTPFDLHVADLLLREP